MPLDSPRSSRTCGKISAGLRNVSEKSGSSLEKFLFLTLIKEGNGFKFIQYVLGFVFMLHVNR